MNVNMNVKMKQQQQKKKFHPRFFLIKRTWNVSIYLFGKTTKGPMKMQI